MSKPWYPAPQSAPSGGNEREQPSDADRRRLSSIPGLLELQGRLLEHCFRLQHHQQALLARVQRKRRGPGVSTIQQLELERQRLGRELHTGVGQILAATRLQLEIIESQLPNAPTTVKQALARVSMLAGQALDQVRSVSRRLHPPEWQRLSLADAMQQLWETSGVPEKFRASFRIDGLAGMEPELESKILFYRAFQEALSNLARHSRATAVETSLEVVDGRLVLTVRDDGVGFDLPSFLAAPPKISAGIGLRAIREQALAAGGTLSVKSGPGGTSFIVSVPFRC